MKSIKFKVIGLTRPGFEPAGSRFEPARFGFPDLPAREAGTLLILPLYISSDNATLNVPLSVSGCVTNIELVILSRTSSGSRKRAAEEATHSVVMRSEDGRWRGGGMEITLCLNAYVMW